MLIQARIGFLEKNPSVFMEVLKTDQMLGSKLKFLIMRHHQVGTDLVTRDFLHDG